MNKSDSYKIAKEEAMANSKTTSHQTDEPWGRTDGVSKSPTRSDENTINEGQLSEYEPLTPTEFYSVLRDIDSLGFTWTRDLPPSVRAKDRELESTLDFNELRRIQNEYPNFPNELGYIIWYILTGTKPVKGLVGSEEELEKKAEMVRAMVISPEFSSEFFFKHMLKVPFFSDIDWEVVVKKFERGVMTAPNNAYALISILLESTVHDVEKVVNFTFAADEQRIESLVKQLSDILFALQRARYEINTTH